MDIQQASDFFTMMHLAKFREGYTLDAVQSISDHFTVAVFSVPEDGTCMTLSVSQKSERMFPRDSGYEYSDARIFLVKMNSMDDYQDLANAELTYIGGAISAMQRDTYLEANDLAAGDYLVYANIDWVDEGLDAGVKNYAVTAYSNFDCNMTVIGQDVISKPAMLRAAGLACLRAGPKNLDT